VSSWEALLLGLVQGATEFLPVSSSGHLVIGQALLGVAVPGVVFEVVVHIATLASILLVYRQRVAELVGGLVAGRGEAWRYAALLVLATLPAVAAGLFLRAPIEALFEDARSVGAALLVTGALLWTTRWSLRRQDWSDAGVGSALAMGVAQSFALVPGISRSGATVVVGLWLGVEPREAAAFSFLMAVPAIGGAAVLQVAEAGPGVSAVPGGALALGGLAAAVTGVAAIRTFVALLRKRAFHHFAPYCWVVGGGFLAWLAVAS